MKYMLLFVLSFYIFVVLSNHYDVSTNDTTTNRRQTVESTESISLHRIGVGSSDRLSSYPKLFVMLPTKDEAETKSNLFQILAIIAAHQYIGDKLKDQLTTTLLEIYECVGT